MSVKTMPNLDSMCLRYRDGRLELLDQRLLPQSEEWVLIRDYKQMVEAIKVLAVRGAPAIGVAAGMSLAQEAMRGASARELKAMARELYEARPTAVNLMWAMDRLALKVPAERLSAEHVVQGAWEIFEEDVRLCLGMAQNGAPLIQDGDNILTHCNTGGLATVGIGTALGVIRYAHEQGKKVHVWVDETRPLLQGGRLTAWECRKLGIPYTIICDNMAGVLMREGRVQKVFLGSDRVARNGDFANKIGTYSVSVLARAHGVAFHPVAPYSTIDPDCPSGAHIPVEERDPQEVRGARGGFGQVSWAPEDSRCFNPSFDVTPVENVTSFVFDHGVFGPESLRGGKHVLHPNSR